MPEISRFLGIVVYMLINDHAPPHFHAKYGAHDLSVEIKTRITKGSFPPRALRALLRWTKMHEDELMQNWHLLREAKLPNKIEPLE